MHVLLPCECCMLEVITNRSSCVLLLLSSVHEGALCSVCLSSQFMSEVYLPLVSNSSLQQQRHQ